MPTTYKGPKLWLRKASKDRTAVWCIVDRSRRVTTGYFEYDKPAAEAFLFEYVRRNYPGGLQPKVPVVSVPRLEQGLIYFLTTDTVPEYPVKIGFSTTATFKVRVSALQIACPYLVKVIRTIPGTREDEWDLHAIFVHLRLRGEWFRRAPDLMDFIENLKRL